MKEYAPDPHSATRSALAVSGLEKLDGGYGILLTAVPRLSGAIADSTSSTREVGDLLRRMGRACDVLQRRVSGAKLLGLVLSEAVHSGPPRVDASRFSVPVLTLILGLTLPVSPRDDRQLVRHLLEELVVPGRAADRQGFVVGEALSAVRMAESVAEEYRQEITSGDVVASLGLAALRGLGRDNPDLDQMPMSWVAAVADGALRDESLGRFPQYTRAAAGLAYANGVRGAL